MRLIALLFICLLLATAPAGCAPVGSAGSDSNGKINIVTTIFAPYDFARVITGGNANIEMLLPPASESHSFEPTPRDILKIRDCDVFIYVGGESDEWVDGILESIDTDRIKIVTLMDCVDVVEEEIIEGMEDDGAGEDAEAGEIAAYDEHVWTSPKNAKLIVQRISDAICAVDNKNASFYENNTTAYLLKLDELDEAFKTVVEGGARKTIIFGDRFPFRYFTDAFGLDYLAAFPGCSAETEPNARTISYLINKINEEKLPVVFHAELSNKKMAETISEATGAKVLMLHACHNISKDDFQNGTGYLELMTRNVDALKEALK